MSTELTSIRAWRLKQGLNLEEMCKLISDQGLDRPSAAKLSRIEREQDVPPEMIPALEAITGIPAKEQRPDLAKLFLKNAEAAE